MKLLEDVDQNSASTDQESSSDSDSDDSSDSDDEFDGSDSDAPSEEPINKGSSSIEALVAQKPTTAQPTKQAPTKQAPPSDGKQRTRARNRRRRDAKKLAWLKSKGHLPATANRQDLKKWREDNDDGHVLLQNPIQMTNLLVPSPVTAPIQTQNLTLNPKLSRS
jgi:hypothetical protein